MLKTKQKRFAIVAVLLFSMIAMYGGMPTVNAASMDNARTTISDSEPAATLVQFDIEFNLGTALVQDDYVNVEFPAGFLLVSSGNLECPDAHVEGGAGQNLTCTIDAGGMDNTSTSTMTVTGITNPVIGSYTITVESRDSAHTPIETTQTKVYIINDVTMTANVAASLTFAIHGTTTGAVINGDTTGASSSADSIPFGTVTSTGGDGGSGEYRMGQHLEVSTNATAGFSVTVQQDGNMLNGGGADIDSFPFFTPTDWADPAGTLDVENTYGHLGVASDDSDLTASFADGFYQGLNGTTPLEVMSHDGPSDGSTDDKGLARVMYNLQVTDLQEAGDYQNVLTYVCTPTF